MTLVAERALTPRFETIGAYSFRARLRTGNMVHNEFEPIPVLVWAAAAVIFVIFAAHMFVGTGVKRHKQWARYLGVALALTALPIGTVIESYIPS